MFQIKNVIISFFVIATAISTTHATTCHGDKNVVTNDGCPAGFKKEAFYLDIPICSDTGSFGNSDATPLCSELDLESIPSTNGDVTIVSSGDDDDDEDDDESSSTSLLSSSCMRMSASIIVTPFVIMLMN